MLVIDNELTISDKVKEAKKLKSLKFMKVKFNKKTKKILSESKKTYPSLTDLDVDNMIYLSSGRLKIEGINDLSVIIIEDDYVTAPQDYWDAIVKARGLITQLTRKYSETTDTPLGSIWKYKNIKIRFKENGTH